MKLNKEAQTLFDEIKYQYELDDPSSIAILKLACESLQIIRDCEKIIAEEGYYVRDKYQQLRSHPCTVTLKDARSALLQSLKLLNLEGLPTSNVGRPADLKHTC